MSVTEEQVVAIVRERFEWVGEPAVSADLRRDVGLDSLHLVELQVAVEDRFQVAFDPLDEQLVEAFRSIRHLAAYVDYLDSRGSAC